MNRKDRKFGKRDSSQRFICLDHYLFRSDAYRALSPAERSILLEVMGRYSGYNNASLSFAASEGVRIGISKATTARALKRIEAMGFIVTVTPSGFIRKNRLATEYRLTMFETDAAPATKDFMRFKLPINGLMGETVKRAEAGASKKNNGLISEPHGLMGETTPPKNDPKMPSQSHGRDRGGPKSPSDGLMGETPLDITIRDDDADGADDAAIIMPLAPGAPSTTTTATRRSKP